MLKCYHCGSEVELTTVGFKAVCRKCGNYLHSCVHCRLFRKESGRCSSSTTEPLRDRSSNNYCEEFIPLSDESSTNGKDPEKSREDFEALFGGN